MRPLMTSIMTSVMTSQHDGRHDVKPFLILLQSIVFLDYTRTPIFLYFTGSRFMELAEYLDISEETDSIHYWPLQLGFMCQVWICFILLNINFCSIFF